MSEAPHPQSLQRRALKSGGWSIGRTLVNALAQFVSLVVLLRLLDPSDFGALSLVMVVLTLTQAFTQTGVDLALVRERGDITSWLSPYFTLQMTRGVILGGVVALLAVPVSLWQESPPLAEYLLVASLVPVLEGLRGVSGIIFLRNLDQRVPALIDGACSILSVISLVALALWLRSPWAVIINQLFATGIRSLSYHVCHPFRARLNWQWGSLRRFFRFGLGFNLAQTSGTLVDTLDRLLIGRHLGLGMLGLYDRSAALANYGLHLLPQFSASVIFPAFAGLTPDRPRFWRVVRRFVFWVAFAGAVLTGLVRLGDRFLLELAAGERAIELLPFFRILLLCAFLRGISVLAQVLLDVLGRPQLRAVVNATHAAVLVAGLSWVLVSGELWQACVVALVGGGVSAVMSLTILVSIARGELSAANPEAGRPSPKTGVTSATTS